MQVTDVRVFPVDEEKLKAYASIVFEACFIVNDLKIIQGRKGLFVSMPSRRRKRGGYRDVAHPLNSETREMIERRVLAEYARSLEGAASRPAEEPVGDPAPEETARVEPREVSPVAAAAPSFETSPTEVRAAQPESGPAVTAATESRTKLEEVEEQHLSDSFWSVS